MFENKETHSSYGMLQFNRTSCSGGKALFGSSIQHKENSIFHVFSYNK